MTLCRDLSKPGEEVVLTTLEKALNAYRQDRPKGELAPVIERKGSEP